MTCEGKKQRVRFILVPKPVVLAGLRIVSKMDIRRAKMEASGPPGKDFRNLKTLMEDMILMDFRSFHGSNPNVEIL